MAPESVNDEDLTEAIAAERRDLAELLAGLPAASWDAPTLCSGWRVREVVAHMTMPFRYSALRFAFELIKSRGDFNKMADRCARKDAAGMTASELVATLKENERYPWKPPGGGFTGALTHDVIHGLDITVALGNGRKVPAEHLRIVLANITSAKSLKFFGAHLNGVRMEADDMEWSFGSGMPVSGPAQTLALVLSGRKLPAQALPGAPSSWLADPQTGALADGRRPAGAPPERS